MKRLVIILGMHRSGTSVVTQISQYMGAYLGGENELIAATRENPDGYFENTEITRINSHILHICGREWYSLKAIEIDNRSLPIIAAKDELKNRIQKLFEKRDTVAVKDPRIAVLLPLWEEILESLEITVGYIWVVRNPLEVKESLRKRDGFRQKHGLLLWIKYNLGIAKFLKYKDYLMINYNNLLEDMDEIKSLGDFFGVEYGSDLFEKVKHIIKREYAHSKYSEQEVYRIKDDLLSKLYDILMENEIKEADILSLEKQYIQEVDKLETRYIDYQALEHMYDLRKKEIIIYGAGNYGKHAAKMLRELGIQHFNFCDKDISKQGNYIMGGKVISIDEISENKNILVIIALADKKVYKAAEQTLSTIRGIEFFSFFALEKIWTYLTKNCTTMETKEERLSLWYKKMEWRSRTIRDAYKYPILVYQSGKVASTTISDSLQNAGIKNVHIHRFFFKWDIIGELILGREEAEFIKNSNYFVSQSPKFVKGIKDKMRCKKIITLVREPIAMDLSTVFQWIGSGIADFYFAERMQKGESFSQVVTALMIQIQNGLFRWFEEELNELCDINIWEHPFDREKGYSIISKDKMEILILKVEKLDQMTEVIRQFVGNSQFQIESTNRGIDKEYSHIYKELKNSLRLPKDYVDFYYHDNPYMDYFYTQKEQRDFLDKWKKCI